MRPSKVKIPQDDGLHKSPVQEIDLEESVLGAVISESAAYHKISSFLKPEHFYLEQHVVIFGACRAIVQDNRPIDSRTVVRELRQIGKLEIAGGASYIAELTEKVSTSGNIEEHARILLQTSIKREVSRIGSKLSQEAYDDTSDALEILQRSIDDLNALQTTSVVRSAESLIKDHWKDLIITDEPPAEQVLIKIDDADMATPGNHSLVTGEKKSRKSLFVVHEIGLFFEQNKGASGSEVCLFDTEQGKRHVWKYKDRVKRLTNRDITTFYLRGKGFKDRQQIIENTLKFWPTKIRLIVIDGIRDLVSNINDPDECTALIEWLERLILQHNIHVINVLHLNKTDGNARGHLGSELQNKAEASIKVKYDRETNLSTVECESSREKGFEPFAFQHGPDGLPQLENMPTNGSKINDDDRRNRLSIIFSDGPMKYKALMEGVETQFGTSQRKSRTLIGEFMRLGWIVKNGPDRSPNTVYKLMVPSSNGYGNLTPIDEAIEKKAMEINRDDDAPLPF